MRRDLNSAYRDTSVSPKFFLLQNHYVSPNGTVSLATVFHGHEIRKGQPSHSNRELKAYNNNKDV